MVVVKEAELDDVEVLTILVIVLVVDGVQTPLDGHVAVVVVVLGGMHCEKYSFTKLQINLQQTGFSQGPNEEKKGRKKKKRVSDLRFLARD